MYYDDAVSGGSQTGIACGLSSIGGFLVPALFIHIPMSALTLVSEGGAVCGNSARTDLRGGWAVMPIPTATPSAALGADRGGAEAALPHRPICCWPQSDKSQGFGDRVPIQIPC